MKKALSLLLALALIPLSPALADTADARKAGRAYVYLGSLLYPEELTVWHVPSREDVPYVSVREYMELCFYLADICDYKIDSSSGISGSRLIVKCGDGRAVFSADRDTVTLSDPEEFMTYMTVCSPSYTDVFQYSETHDSTYRPGDALTVDLSDYGLDIVPADRDVLIPFQAAEVLFGMNMTGYALVYNGQDFYDVSFFDDTNAYVYGSASPSPYQDAFYSGPFSEAESLTDSYSRYYLGCLALMMDLLHGRSEETGYTSMLEYLRENGLYDLLTSRDAGDLYSGVDTLLGVLFDTSHDGYTGDSGVFDSLPALGWIRREHETETAAAAMALRSGAVLSAEEEEAEAEEKWQGPLESDSDVEKLTQWYMGGDISGWYGPESRRMINWTCLTETLRGEDNGRSTLSIVRDTAVITFDAFVSDSYAASRYYLSLPARESWDDDTFGFLYGCFDIISRMPEVKRVVIDLSNNGGGDVPALVQALGFLSPDGEVNLTYRNTYTGAFNSDWFHVDTDLNGVMDENDGWGGRYDFYIVTSGSTYSCANAMAFFAAKQGLARVIGRESGGGDCVVNLWYDAVGLLSTYSGSLKFGITEKGRFVSSEDAVPLTARWGSGTYALDAPWFDAEGITDFIDRLEEEREDDAA